MESSRKRHRLQNTRKHCTYSAVQSVQKRGTHRTRLAQELYNIFVRLQRISHLVRSVSPFVHTPSPSNPAVSRPRFVGPSNTVTAVTAGHVGGSDQRPHSPPPLFAHWSNAQPCSLHVPLHDSVSHAGSPCHLRCRSPG